MSNSTSKKSPAGLDAFLNKGDMVGGYRSQERARQLLPDMQLDLAIFGNDEIHLDQELTEYVADVVLGADWYNRHWKQAKTKTLYYLVANGVLVIAIPVGIAALGSLASHYPPSYQAYGILIAQLSSVVTGLFALQKSVSIWYAQQQNYAGWYKCSSDLKELYYGLVRKWHGQVLGHEPEIRQDLADGAASARRIMQAERLDFFTKLALPSFDILDMLTSSKTNVTSLITSLIPATPQADAVAMGTKTLLGTRLSAATDISSKNLAALKIDALASAPQVHTQGSVLSGERLPPFDQDVVNACAGISVSNAADILAALGNQGSFFAWYNSTFNGISALADHFPSSDTTVKRARFNAFWNQIGVIFERPSITATEFCALMAINLEESDGGLSAAAEKVNGMNHPHPGLAYAFDVIPEAGKQTYNHAPNHTALALFEDPRFTEAHGNLSGAQNILGRPGGIDPRWGGDTWPSDMPANPDDTRNGFVMEADFYKFRGRGVIQTTWRSDYKLLINWILSSDAAKNPTLASLAAAWRKATPDVTGDAQLEAIATISTNAQWDLGFAEGLTLAKGVAIDSDAKNKYLTSLTQTADALGGGRQARGSLLYFAAHINGGGYPDRVAPMMKALMCGLAQTIGAAPMGRPTRNPEIMPQPRA